MDNLNIIDLFLSASFLVQLIILLLLAFSVISWAIIFQKLKQIKQTKKSLESFDEKFLNQKKLAILYSDIKKLDEIEGKAQVFSAGYHEYRRLTQLNHESPKVILDASQRKMRLTINQQLDSLDKNISYLGLIGSISPYIGLFGTVWGIMHAFISLGSVKQATLQMVAPGIAEALIATAIGLFAAIPAVMAHNRLSSKVMEFEQNYYNFIDEFSSLLQRQSEVNKK